MTRRERDLFKQRYHAILYGTIIASNPEAQRLAEEKRQWVEDQLALPIDEDNA